MNLKVIFIKFKVCYLHIFLSFSYIICTFNSINLSAYTSIVLLGWMIKINILLDVNYSLSYFKMVLIWEKTSKPYHDHSKDETYKKSKIRKLIKEIYRLFKLSFMSDNVFELPRIFVVITVVFKFSLCVL